MLYQNKILNGCTFSLKTSLIQFVVPPVQESEGGGGCFPSSARVTLENGKLVAMSELQTGHKVQTGRDIGFSDPINNMIY